MPDNENNEQCDCCEPNCDECNQHLADQDEASEKADQIREIVEREESELQRQLEGGDEDDYDEEDMHGSRPIGEPNEDEDK